MQVEEVSDAGDPRLSDYREIRDRPLAQDSGKFVAESAEVVRRLLESRLEVRSLLLSRSVLPRLRDLLRPGVPTFIVDDALVRALVGFPFHRGALAIGVRPTQLELPASLRRVGSR